MGSAPLVLLALAGGFVLVELSKATRYRIRRAEGQRLLLYSACAAFFLIIVSRLSLSFVASAFPTLYGVIRATWTELLPTHDPWLATLTGAFLLGFVVACLSNHVYDLENATDELILRYGKELEKLLTDSMRREMPILVTLRSRKVYVGMIVRVPPILDHDLRYVRLLPIVTGYRDEKTLEWAPTTQYSTILARISSKDASLEGDITARDFEIVIPVSEIVSANLFSPELDQEDFRIPDPDT